MHSCIFKGRVIHHRLQPHKHRFSYGLFMMHLDLDELPSLFEKFRFWSTERFALACFKRKDHYGDPSLPLATSIRDLVETRTGKKHHGPITLLTHLRYFGYVMNPVSFYYCWNDERTQVETVIAEVHNTPWGEQHCYVLDGEITQGKNRQFNFNKSFHVSPFMNMDQEYAWYFNCPDERLHISMQSFENEQHMFTASMRLQSEPISQSSLNRVMFNYPLMTVKVIAAIYWQALKLWWKKTPFYEHPKHYSGEGASL